MKSFRFLCALVVATALLIPAGAEAQTPGLGVRLGGGPTIPVGHLGEETSTGFHAMGGLALGVPHFPIALRVDAMYARLPDVEGGHFQNFSGTLNGVYRLPGLGLTPYLIGGIGVYNSRFTEGEEDHDHDHGDESTVNVGANLGAGIQLSILGLGAFIEARFHHLFHEGEATQFMPVTIGITF
jgi:hypothetical protein